MTKMHYPPRAEDAVGLMDRIFDKAVEMTKPVKALAQGVQACAEQMRNIAHAVAILAHNQAVHHHMIGQMWQVQQQIFKKLSEHSMNMEMPDIDNPVKIDPKDAAAVAAAEARKKAENKPN